MLQQVLINTANILNIDKNNITINSIVDGSTIVNGQISTDNYNTAVSLANSLYTAIQNNPNVLGIPILSTSIGAYYDDTQTYNPAGWQGIAGIIIGCSIALGVLIVIIIVILCCIKKYRKGGQYGEENSEEKRLAA